MEVTPIVRIFPHKVWFTKSEDLRSWLHFGLRNRGGYYFLKTIAPSIVDHTPVGSIVLFRLGDSILGEAVVKHDLMRSNVPAYETMIQFDPSSIRIFPRPLRLKRLETLIGKKLSGEMQYYKFSMSSYGWFLNEMVSEMDFTKLTKREKKMVEIPPVPIIRIFPDIKGYKQDEDIRGWLHFTVRERGGTYYFRNVPSAMKNEKTPPGSIILFREGDELIGEAVVKKDISRTNNKDFSMMISFEPFTIRIYRYPLRINKLMILLDRDLSNPHDHYTLPMSQYGTVLRENVSHGFI